MKSLLAGGINKFNLNNMETVWCSHLFYKDRITDLEVPDGRVRVWFGKNAKKEIDKWASEYTKLNDFIEIESTDFNDRLLIKNNKYKNKRLPVQHLEVFKLQGKYFVNNCN